MASKSMRLLERQIIYASKSGKPVDLGAFKYVGFSFNVLELGSAGTIKLQHATVDEEDAYLDLGDALDVSGSGTVATTFQSSEAWGRFVRWSTDANVAGNPVVQIDIVAKEY